MDVAQMEAIIRPKVAAIYRRLAFIVIVGEGDRPAVALKPHAHQPNACEKLGACLARQPRPRLVSRRCNTRNVILCAALVDRRSWGLALASGCERAGDQGDAARKVDVDLALPQAQHRPTVIEQRGGGGAVALHIAPDLAQPIRLRGRLAELFFERGQTTPPPLIAVPEVAIHKDSQPRLSKHKI